MIQRFMHRSGLVLLLLCVCSISFATECDFAGHHMLAPLIGDWEEYQVSESDEELLGTLKTRMVSENCAVVQSFLSPDGMFSFNSLGYIDSTGNWVETYVLSNGRFASYKWRSNGDELILDRVAAADQPRRRRRLFAITKNNYLVTDEESQDAGKTWQRLELVKTIRTRPAEGDTR